MQLFDGEKFRAVAVHGLPEEMADKLREGYAPGPYMPVRQLLGGEQIVHVRDLAEIDHPLARTAAEAGIGTALYVALRKDDSLLGQIVASRKEVRPFSDKEIALLQNFAAQAVIAMENARLLTEQREALEQQTATAQVLEVINASPGNLAPVFDTLLERAMQLCGAAFGHLDTHDGKTFHTAAVLGVPAKFAEYRNRNPSTYGPGTGPDRMLAGEHILYNFDLKEDDVYRRGEPNRRALVDLGGARSAIQVALRKDEAFLGFITLFRQEVRPFTEKQGVLLQNFAAQAVIAMENARLLGELTRREQELSVTFDHMGDGVVMFDADLHIGAWNRNFQELLDIDDAFLATRPSLDDYVRLLVERGEVGHGNPDEEIVRYRSRSSQPWSTERSRPDGRTIEVRNNPVPGGGAVLIYGDITERKKAEAEIREARDAAEIALERQTATADILKVIAGSPNDVQPVFDVVVKAAVRFCGAQDSVCRHAGRIGSRVRSSRRTSRR